LKGCLTVFLVVLAVGLLAMGGCLGYACVKGKEYEEKMAAATARLDAIDARQPYTAPADGLIPAERFTAWLEVRADAARTIQPAIERLEASGQGMEQKTLGLKESVRFFLEIVDLHPASWNALATALEQHEMAFAEFRWLTETTYATLIGAADRGNVEARALVDAIETLHQPPPGAAEKGLDVEAFPDLRKTLQDRIAAYDPQNLERILAQRDALAATPGPLTIDMAGLPQAEAGDEQH
jgi:hypothetical protein